MLKNLFSNVGQWESEDSVSLDPCSCHPACRPTGISRFLYLPIWEDYSKKDDEKAPNPLDQTSRTGRKSMRGLLLVDFFAVLPSGG